MPGDDPTNPPNLKCCIHMVFEYTSIEHEDVYICSSK